MSETAVLRAVVTDILERLHRRVGASGTVPGLDPTDLAHCSSLLEQGSRSFHAASRILPRRVRQGATCLYAFCRVADDAVDESVRPMPAVEALEARVDAIYGDGRLADPVDRAFRWATRTFAIPRAIPDALLDGFRWDAVGRRYDTLDDLLGYCARVASTVGVMMTLVMGRRETSVLARACDLGLAMQLTNMARDVGEDARAGRLYLPLEWLAEESLRPNGLLERPRFSPALGRVVARLLRAADDRYRLADTGIGSLPLQVRPAIYAARLIYREIGRVLEDRGHDGVTQRAVVTGPRKAVLIARALSGFARLPSLDERPPHPSVSFLVEAVREQRFPAS